MFSVTFISTSRCNDIVILQKKICVYSVEPMHISKPLTYHRVTSCRPYLEFLTRTASPSLHTIDILVQGSILLLFCSTPSMRSLYFIWPGLLLRWRLHIPKVDVHVPMVWRYEQSFQWLLLKVFILAGYWNEYIICFDHLNFYMFCEF